MAAEQRREFKREANQWTPLKTTNRKAKTDSKPPNTNERQQGQAVQQQKERLNPHKHEAHPARRHHSSPALQRNQELDLLGEHGRVPLLSRWRPKHRVLYTGAYKSVLQVGRILVNVLFHSRCWRLIWTLDDSVQHAAFNFKRPCQPGANLPPPNHAVWSTNRLPPADVVFWV